MTRPVGEIFEFNGVKLVVHEVQNCFCDGCYYQNTSCELLFGNNDTKKECGQCASQKRPDGKNVIFKEVK
jgi:hypothetical protein